MLVKCLPFYPYIVLHREIIDLICYKHGGQHRNKAEESWWKQTDDNPKTIWNTEFLFWSASSNGEYYTAVIMSIRFFFCYFVHKLHFLKIIFNFDHLSCVYTLRLIWSISYPGECDLMVHTRSTASFCHEGVLFSNLVPRVFRKYPGSRYEIGNKNRAPIN